VERSTAPAGRLVDADIAGGVVISSASTSAGQAATELPRIPSVFSSAGGHRGPGPPAVRIGERDGLSANRGCRAPGDEEFAAVGAGALLRRGNASTGRSDRHRRTQ